MFEDSNDTIISEAKKRERKRGTERGREMMWLERLVVDRRRGGANQVGHCHDFGFCPKGKP